MTNDMQDTPTSTESSTERAVEKVAEALDIHIPKERVPLPLRILMLLMVIGGLSILGSSITDFTITSDEGLIAYLYRLVTGIGFLSVAYFIYARSRWASWIYGGITFIGLLFNFSKALVPALIVFYLYKRRNYLKPTIADTYANMLIEKLKTLRQR